MVIWEDMRGVVTSSEKQYGHDVTHVPRLSDDGHLRLGVTPHNFMINTVCPKNRLHFKILKKTSFFPGRSVSILSEHVTCFLFSIYV